MNSTTWPKIFLFGDSQVERSFELETGFWGALLCNRLRRISDVIPRGFSGYNSRSARNIFPRLFTQENLRDVSAFVIFLGSNDLSGKDEGSELYVPVKEYSENIEFMINKLNTLGVEKEKIILISPGAYDNDKFLKWCEENERTFPSKKSEDFLEYTEACVKLAQKHNIDVINLHLEMTKDEDWKDYLRDGLHLSAKGSMLLFDLLLPLIEKRVNMEERLMPYWRDINHIRVS